MSNSEPEEPRTEHSLIVFDCRDCAQADTVTKLEHPRDSAQHYAVLDAHEILADEHHKETGHNVDLKHYGGSPDEMLEMARTFAKEVDGVEDDAFAEELVA